MGFEVQITDEAFGGLGVIAGFVKRQATIEIARKWFTGIIDPIETFVGLAPALSDSRMPSASVLQ